MIAPAQVYDYQAYILRIWKESGEWRFSIESLGSDQRTGFTKMEELFAFLEDTAPSTVPEDKAV